MSLVENLLRQFARDLQICNLSILFQFYFNIEKRFIKFFVSISEQYYQCLTNGRVVATVSMYQCWRSECIRDRNNTDIINNISLRQNTCLQSMMKYCCMIFHPAYIFARLYSASDNCGGYFVIYASLIINAADICFIFQTVKKDHNIDLQQLRGNHYFALQLYSHCKKQIFVGVWLIYADIWKYFCCYCSGCISDSAVLFVFLFCHFIIQKLYSVLSTNISKRCCIHSQFVTAQCLQMCLNTLSVSQSSSAACFGVER